MKWLSRKLFFATVAFLACAGIAVLALIKGQDAAAWAGVAGTVAAAYLGGQAWVDRQ